MIAERSDRLDLARRTRRLAGVVRLGRRAEPASSARCPRSAATRRALIGDYHGVDRRDGRRHRHGDAVRARRVLHRRRSTTPRRGSSRRWSGRCSAASWCACCSTTSRPSASALHEATIAELDRIGVKWSYMLAVQPFKGKYQRPDLRNHRKLVVVDGRVGYTGLAEPHRPQLRLGEEPQARPAVAGAGDPGHRTDGDGDQRGVPVGLVRETDELLGDEENVPRRRGARRPLARRPRLPGRAERSGVRRREQPAPVPVARVTPRRSGSSSRARTSCPTRR